jgi:biotin carboxylase
VLVIVQPLSSGIQLAQHAVRAGYQCLIPTDFPELLPAEVHARAHVVGWHPGQGVQGLLSLVKEAGQAPAGVLAGFEYVVPEAAELAAALGLPALSLDTAIAVRQKDAMRTRCREHGITVPGSVLVNQGTWPEPPFPLPVVVKPVDCGGSLMVSLARDLREYAAARAEIENADEVKFHSRPRQTALVEQFVDGPEFSVEGWADPAGIHLASITTKFVSEPPVFYEMAHISTSPAASPWDELLTGFTRRVVEAFGVTVGAFHVEARIAADGQPVLIELGARLAGDLIPELILAGPGVNLYQAAIDAACGTAHPGRPSGTDSAGLAFVTGQQPGPFAGSLSGLSPYQAAAEFRQLIWEMAAGTAVNPDDIFSNRVAQIFFTGELSMVEKLVAGVLRDVTVDLSDKESSSS